MSEEQKLAALEKKLDERWAQVLQQAPDVERPETEVVRFIAPQDRAQVISQCLNDAGFAATPDANGTGIIQEGVEAQAGAAAVATFVCDATYPIDPAQYLPLSGEEARFLYDYLSGPLRECLANEGYETGEPPSFQTFGQSLSWSPWEEVFATANLTAEQLADLNQKCPQLPSGLRGN